MKVFKSFFSIGIYDPSQDDFWPYHYRYEDGVYLSKKYRKCGDKSSAVFDTPEAARHFFNTWKHKDKYKFEIIETKRWTEVPEPTYPENHPNNLIKVIEQNERTMYSRTARLWLRGENLSKLYSKRTLKAHRDKLLKYNIDIFEQPTQLLEKNIIVDDVRHIQNSNLRVVN